jgi:hypothetical protein
MPGGKSMSDTETHLTDVSRRLTLAAGASQ